MLVTTEIEGRKSHVTNRQLLGCYDSCQLRTSACHIPRRPTRLVRRAAGYSLGWSVGWRIATRSFCMMTQVSRCSYVSSLPAGVSTSSHRDGSCNVGVVRQVITHLQHVQERRLAGVIKAEEQQLGVLVQQPEGGEDIVDWTETSESR